VTIQKLNVLAAGCPLQHTLQLFTLLRSRASFRHRT